MNKTILIIIFLPIITVFTVQPIFGDEEPKIIISEIDGNVFTAAINSTIIATNGTVIGKVVSVNPSEVGKIFVLELKEKAKTDPLEFLTHPLVTVLVGSGAITSGLTWLIRHPLQKRDKKHEEIKRSSEIRYQISKLITEMIADFRNSMSLLEEISDEKEKKSTGLTVAHSLFKQHLHVVSDLVMFFPKYADKWNLIGLPMRQLVDVYRISDKNELMNKWKSDKSMRDFSQTDLEKAYETMTNTEIRHNIEEKLTHSAINFVQKLRRDDATIPNKP